MVIFNLILLKARFTLRIRIIILRKVIVLYKSRWILNNLINTNNYVFVFKGVQFVNLIS